jgi:hypothetical protein
MSVALKTHIEQVCSNKKKNNIVSTPYINMLSNNKIVVQISFFLNDANENKSQATS